MKKFRATILTMAVMALTTTGAFADDYSYDVDVTVRDAKVVFTDARPLISKAEGKTLIPIRAVAENLGAQVDWDAEKSEATISLNGTEIKLQTGCNYAMVDGDKIELDTAARIISNRTYVPIRFISEVLGLWVGWNESARTVSINDSEPLFQVQKDNKIGFINNKGEVVIELGKFNYGDWVIDLHLKVTTD